MNDFHLDVEEEARLTNDDLLNDENINITEEKSIETEDLISDSSSLHSVTSQEFIVDKIKQKKMLREEKGFQHLFRNLRKILMITKLIPKMMKRF